MPSLLPPISRIVTAERGCWALCSVSTPSTLKLYADGGYQGPEFRASVNAILSQVDVKIVA